MNPSIRTALFGLACVLAGCGSGTDSRTEEPLDTDYSDLRLAAPREGALVSVTDPERLLHPLRNGIRLSLSEVSVPFIAGVTAPDLAGSAPYTVTTIQVEGVDEPDPVKYDGRHIFAVRPESVPAKPGMTRNVLKIARTHPDSATLEVTAEFEIAGDQSADPVVYQLQNEEGAAEFIVAVTQDFSGWSLPQPQAVTLVVQPDRTKVQLLDVRDPYNVSQAWEIELEGWLRGSRKIGDILYLVSSYRPRLPSLTWPAGTKEAKRENERRIRGAGAEQLLPTFRVNSGAAQQLAAAGDCVIAADLESEEAYTDLLVITSIDLRERRIHDVACVSTNVNGLYVSHESLYVGATIFPSQPGIPEQGHFTVLHKFALDDGTIEYRASGVFAGQLPWQNAAYFMDERHGYLRIVTTEDALLGNPIHRLGVFKETMDGQLELVATLPNMRNRAPIGKPGEQVHAVRFFEDRAYVVTARFTDPLYVIDFGDPFEPFIAGELQIPGFSSFLQPLELGTSKLLLSIGHELSPGGLNAGVKVELFDVTLTSQPQSLGVYVFGENGSASEAVNDPHALTVLAQPGQETSVRIGLPIDVYATPHPTVPNLFHWTYSGFHLLEISRSGDAPQLELQGVLKTEESSSPGMPPPYASPRRAILHGDAVFGVNGETYVTQFWDAIAQP